MSSMRKMLDRIRPDRKIHAVSAVFLPFTQKGRPDLDEFERHLRRTVDAGLEPAVNMDTGFGPQLEPAQREEILRLTRRALGPSTPFVAGAIPFGEARNLDAGYRTAIRKILDQGATPILFPSELFAEGADVVQLYRELAAPCPRILGFELGPMFAPFGRIFDLETFRRLLEIPTLAGLKHSSLDRRQELARLEIRDRERPDFRIYTGNDLAIDMILYGSDYLLGLSTFAPEAFGIRDRLWAAGDDRFFEVNDALQALGHVAFRDPVPAYKESAAVYLRLTGQLTDPHVHTDCPHRPAWEAELLQPFAKRIEEAVRKS